MPKRVYIIHGWGGYPEEGWFPWLKKELERRGFEVYVPAMPDPSEPKIKTWIPFLGKLVGSSDLQTFFVGHSIGCQTIIRYLETLPEGVKIGGAIFVAGWFNLTDETWDETCTKEIADEWMNTPINFEKIKKHTDKFVLITSDNDPYVLLSNAGLFRNNLGSKIIIEKNKGHISGEDGVTKLPIVLEELLRIAKGIAVWEHQETE